MTIRGVSLALLACSAIACGPGPSPQLAPLAAPSPPLRTKSTIATAMLADGEPADSPARRVLQMLGVVSRLRDLPALQPVRGQVVDRSTMIAQLREHIRVEIPPEVLRGQGEFLRAFGWIPPDYDFETGLYALIENQLAGYYDPDRKKMFLVDDLSTQEADATLAHELVHALQDQHYDLAPRLRYQPDANDAQSAIQCLAEGDATSAMLDYLLAPHGRNALATSDMEIALQVQAGMALSPSLRSVPSVLRNSLVAPYVDGVLLVHSLRRQGGWPSVDAVWRNPPTTTEQVLHPDKLVTRESAQPVSVPSTASLGDGWTITYTDVYGEQGFRIAIEEWMPAKVARSAATGWAGDRAIVASRSAGGATITVAAWHLRFDRALAPAAENAEAQKAYEAIVKSWSSKTRNTHVACRASPSGAPIVVLVQQRELVLVAGSPQSAESNLLNGCRAATRWATSIAKQP